MILMLTFLDWTVDSSYQWPSLFNIKTCCCCCFRVFRRIGCLSHGPPVLSVFVVFNCSISHKIASIPEADAQYSYLFSTGTQHHCRRGHNTSRRFITVDVDWTHVYTQSDLEVHWGDSIYNPPLSTCLFFFLHDSLRIEEIH